MIVTQHWTRQFDVGTEWRSPFPSLSPCGRGLEYGTEFQTHVSVIYRLVFHRRAVQGLRNACSVLPGLSACRLCLLPAHLRRTHACTLCMSMCAGYTHTSLAHTHALSVCGRTHPSQAALLHYTPGRLPDDYHASPIITRISISPWKTFPPPE